MFHSKHAAGALHAAARAVGGCPVYVSDAPGAHDVKEGMGRYVVLLAVGVEHVLLGLLLATVNKAPAWDQWDQLTALSALPASRRARAGGRAQGGGEGPGRG